MKNNTTEQEAIISLLTRIYTELLPIEEQFRLIVGGADMRPRIDYFHDAVRAFTVGDGENPRLSVELLAYDLQCLRYIIKMPLSPFKQGGESLSPSQNLMTTDGNIMPTANRPNRETKARLIELYQNYAVMFSALLKPIADHDYKDRSEMLNNEAEDIHSLINQFEGKLNANIIAGLAQNLEEHELRIIIMHFLHQQKHKNKDDVKKLVSHLKNHLKNKDKNLKTIDQAHGNFAMAQLGIYEESKDMLKKLASQGMNLVGKFVENSMAETRRQMGR